MQFYDFFFMCIILSTLCTDDEVNVTWRNILMHQFFIEWHEFDLAKLHNGEPDRSFDDICGGWKGVNCDGEVVQEICLYHINYRNVNPSMLPNSTRKIHIEGCSQTFKMNTRCLPKRLLSLDVSLNFIRGSLDLTTLPLDLLKATLHSNQLTGPITLINLPRSLRFLDVRNNKIIQHTVWYDNLPTSLSAVWLVEDRKRDIIHEIRPLSSNMISAIKEIFYKIPPKHIH